jgi:hypothetical protein
MLRCLLAILRDVELCLSPYILTELPANLILRKLGPKVMMPTLLAVWGIIATLQGTWSKIWCICSFLIRA